jgi:hypothetical protein
MNIYRSIYSSLPIEKTSIDHVVNEIQAGRWKLQQSQYLASDKEHRPVIKKCLDCVDFWEAGLVTIDLDFEDKQNSYAIFETLKHWDITRLIGRSIGKIGLFWCVAVPINANRESTQNALEIVLKTALKISPDPSWQNANFRNRRVLMHDENLFFNSNSQKF